jgi:Trp operon repressor
VKGTFVAEETFEAMLTGGHQNSLGRTVEVVDRVLADQLRLRELIDCYQSTDEVVRLRTSSALKRVDDEHHTWLLPFIDELIDDVGKLDQASAQWTLAQLFFRFTSELSAEQRQRSEVLMKRNLAKSDDWIVLISTLETLAQWAVSDPKLRKWLEPHVSRLAKDSRKSVAGRATKKQNLLYG